MLDDRYYMRRPSFGSRRSVTVVLLIVNVIIFLLQKAAPSVLHFSPDPYFALSVAGLRHGFLWQLVTYEFMHAGVLHLLLNCWAIFVFGREVEETLGKRNFLTLYFASGIVGGLVQALAGVIFHGQFAAPVVGASAAAFGLIAAFAMLYPERPLMLLLFFIIPLNMRAKFLLLFSAILAVFGIIFPTDNIAHAAHLGGMITGVVFIRYAIHWHWQWPRLNRTSGRPMRRLVKVHSQKPAPWGREGVVEEDVAPEEFLSKEVDPILDKISAQGMQSLTERERKILDSAGSKIRKR